MALIIIFSFHNSFRNSINCTLNPANIRFDEEVLKTSWRRLSSSPSIGLDQDEYIRLNHTSSEDVFKTSWSRPIFLSSPCVFKTSSRRLLEVLKTSSRRLAKVFWRRIIRSRICIGHTSEKFMVKFSHNSMVVFHFTTSFSGCLQRRF